jgi:hypothetical protein
MASNPLTEVRLKGAVAVFMLGAADDAGTVENVDVEVTLSDGSRWAATLLTLNEIRRLMERWKATGESLGGSYFHCADMVIIEQGGVAAAAEILSRLVETEQIRDVFVRVDIEE